MTTIAIVGSPSGFIVAAEGRMSMPEEERSKATAAEVARESDEVQKVFEISGPSRAFAYALMGTVINDDFSLDLVSESQKQISLLSAKEFDDSNGYLNELSGRLSQVINEAKHYPRNHGRLSPEQPGWNIASIFFAGYFKGFQCLSVLEFYHLGTRVAYFAPRPLESPVLCGSAVVHAAMFEANGNPKSESRFAQYQRPLNSNRSLDEAAAYATGYIEACCSPLALELDPQMCRMSGGHIHVAEVTQAGGFKWRVAPKTVAAKP